MTYDYYIDEKVTIWRRSKYRVKVDNTLHGEFLAAKEFEDLTYDEEVGFIDSEFIYESEEPMEVGDNGGEPTKELYINDELIKTNV